MTTESSPPSVRTARRADEGAPALGGDRARAWLEVDLGALVRNARQVTAHSGRPIVPMVKADAYGLGAVAVARALESVDPWAYGVASVAEGEELRAAGTSRRVIVFTPLLPAELPRARRAGLTPSLHRAEDVRAWLALGGAGWHLAIDTGMNRAGVRWDAVPALVEALGEETLRAHPPEGAYTHFHSADADAASREAQQARFAAAVALLPARPAVLHAENSPAVEHGGRSPWDVVRPGVFLYGVPSGGALAPEAVAHLRARVVDVRTVEPGETVSYGGTWQARGVRRIATVAVGYADGYRRALSNLGEALVHGRPAAVVGVVTMDMTMLDVTDVPCGVGDVATLLGRDGERTLAVAEVAALAALSPYELLAGLRLRVPHLYHGT